MIHRAPFGSFERFISLLIENTAGNFPTWLAPTQVAILPIIDQFSEYAEKVKIELKNNDIRCKLDNRNEKIGRKIRDAEVGKIPYMLIIGEKEIENNTLSIRKHGEGDIGELTLNQFIDKVIKEVN